jgi:hypothetical protein
LDDYAGDVGFDARVIVSDMVATDPSVKNISCGLQSRAGQLRWAFALAGAALEKPLRSGDQLVEVSLIAPKRGATWNRDLGVSRTFHRGM